MKAISSWNWATSRPYSSWQPDLVFNCCWGYPKKIQRNITEIYIYIYISWPKGRSPPFQRHMTWTLHSRIGERWANNNQKANPKRASQGSQWCNKNIFNGKTAPNNTKHKVGCRQPHSSLLSLYREHAITTKATAARGQKSKGHWHSYGRTLGRLLWRP